MENKELIRLQLYLSRCGIASRRKAEELISEGRVTVNGEIVFKQGIKVSSEDIIKFDNKRCYPIKNHVYYALNKPKNYICSNNDPEDRPIAVELLKVAYSGRLFNVGRLDFKSSGLIFFTNDGEFTKIISHPSSKLEKEYEVETKEELSDSIMEEFLKGIYIDNELFKIKSYKILGKRTVHIILTEGKNREIRKFFEYKRFKVRRVHRIRIGIVKVKGVASGHFRKLTKNEIDWFLKRK